MNVYRDIREIERDDNTVLTIGTFDGVHEGHKKIFGKLKEIGEANNSREMVITFEPHPRVVVSKGYDIHLLTTFNEKLSYLAEIGIENVLVLNFTEEFAKQTYEQFVANTIVKEIGVKHMVVGYDHKIGKDRAGDYDKLTNLGDKFGFSVSSVEPFEINGVVVSSTKIRKALDEGEVEKGNLFLGRNYSFEGRVISGATRGRVLGYPTANVFVEEKIKLVPPNGVYIAKCDVDNCIYYGIMNVGIRPTFDESREISIEVHLFDFSNFIYDKIIRVKILSKLRDEKKFGTQDELINQLNTDKKKALDYIKNTK